MEENDIINTLAGLRKLKQQAEAEISKWQIKVSGLDSSIELCESMLLNFSNNQFSGQKNVPSIPLIPENSGATPIAESSIILENYNDFPKNNSSRIQALYLLNKTGRAVRLRFLQEVFSKLVGPHATAIRHPYARLKDEGLVVTARFNGNYQQIFYGLSDWVKTDENGNRTFKEQYRPSESDLPFGYDTIDFDYNLLEEKNG